MHSKFSLKILNLAIFFVLTAAFSLSGQVVTGLKVKSSDIFERLADKKAENSKISASDLATFANELLDKQGVNYEFSFDSNTCSLLDEKRKNLKKDQSKELNVRGTFTPEIGDKTTLFLPEVIFIEGNCKRCFVRLPVVAATEKDFMTIIQERNVNFLLPGNFSLETVALVDNVSPANVKRIWKVPSRTVPIGVSEDGKRLYLDLNINELNDLALVIYENGVAQFNVKKDLNLSEKAAPLKDFPKDSNSSSVSYISFGTGETKRTLKFSSPCF